MIDTTAYKKFWDKPYDRKYHGLTHILRITPSRQARTIAKTILHLADSRYAISFPSRAAKIAWKETALQTPGDNTDQDRPLSCSFRNKEHYQVAFALRDDRKNIKELAMLLFEGHPQGKLERKYENQKTDEVVNGTFFYLDHRGLTEEPCLIETETGRITWENEVPIQNGKANCEISAYLKQIASEMARSTFVPLQEGPTHPGQLK